jgi:hypothetical protein
VPPPPPLLLPLCRGKLWLPTCCLQRLCHRCRLYLGQAEIEADRNRWVRASQHCHSWLASADCQMQCNRHIRQPLAPALLLRSSSPSPRPAGTSACACAWLQPEVYDLARRAATCASEGQPTSPAAALVVAEVELQAEMVAARASLAQGRDADAFKAAQTVGGMGGWDGAGWPAAWNSCMHVMLSLTRSACLFSCPPACPCRISGYV